MPFRFERLEIPDVIMVEMQRLADARGFFMEIYKRSEFIAAGIHPTFVQDNHVHSIRGVLRGLHYQVQPRVQGKLVSVTRGEIFDVAVDIRRGSPTYGRWVSAMLSALDPRMLYVPVGFAHGYCVLSQDAEVVYKVTEEYAPDLERGIIWNDPDLAIPWPVSVPVLSPRDRGLPRLREVDSSFVYAELKP